MKRERSPGFKLFLTGFIAFLLAVPLAAVYLLSWDRQEQSKTAQESIAAGWGGPQTIIGPVLVIPYTSETVETVTQNGKDVTRAVQTVRELYLSPEQNDLTTEIKPKKLKRSIYESVLFEAANDGKATFAFPADFDRYGIKRAQLKLESAELRFGISDSRGLQASSKVSIDGVVTQLQPGKGLNATQNSGFFAFVNWDGTKPLTVKYDYAIRGNKNLTLVPRAASPNGPSIQNGLVPVSMAISCPKSAMCVKTVLTRSMKSAIWLWVRPWL